MLKNALTRLFDYELNMASPVRDDFVQVERVDEDGNILTVYEKFDYPKHQASLGFVKDWSLDSLLRAGISPYFNVHTGFNSRLEAAQQMDQFVAAADDILSDSVSKE